VAKLGSLRAEIPALTEAARTERAAREARLAWMRDPAAGVDSEAPLYLTSVRACDCACVQCACVFGVCVLAVCFWFLGPVGVFKQKFPLTGIHCETCSTSQAPGEKEKEVNDCKLIVQNIVYGMKTLLFSILYCTRMVRRLVGLGGGGERVHLMSSC
jgi:hypothetical protein